MWGEKAFICSSLNPMNESGQCNAKALVVLLKAMPSALKLQLHKDYLKRHSVPQSPEVSVNEIHVDTGSCDNVCSMPSLLSV